MSKVFIQNGTGSTATLENAHNEKIPVYDTLQDAENDLNDLEENQIVATNDFGRANCPFPVGATYPQFPGCSDPNTLWNGTTWVKLDFGGAFFRSNGGNAQAFDNQTTAQADMIKTHTITGGNHRHVFPYLTNGAGGSGGAPDYGVATASGFTSYSGNLTMTYGDATDNPETRPINYTIQVWKRTA